jgi:threonine/homoserine/homoserine lactone efflux protein
MSISPGPVNLITLSTGANHGFKNAMPFVSGATLGFTLLLLMVGLGIGGLVSQNQVLLDLLGYGGTAFICYMGYKIVVSKPEIQIQSKTRPGFYQGFLLQWLNPKAWIACISGISAFNLADSLPMLAIFVSLYFVICYASIASWALVGDKIKIRLWEVLLSWSPYICCHCKCRFSEDRSLALSQFRVSLGHFADLARCYLSDCFLRVSF